MSLTKYLSEREHQLIIFSCRRRVKSTVTYVWQLSWLLGHTVSYHSSSFIACRSIHAVHKLNASAVYPLLEKFFKYQEGYYNTPTYTKTRAAVVAKIANNLVAPVIGEANLAAYRAGLNDSRSDQATRISFKFGCARGVTGTPYYFVNGISLGDLDFPLDYDKWVSTLDPLVGKM